MNETASFLVHRARDTNHGPERTYRGIWFEERREWRIHLTNSADSAELWSTEGWDSKRAMLLAFQDSHITYSETAPE